MWHHVRENWCPMGAGPRKTDRVVVRLYDSGMADTVKLGSV